MTDMTSGNRYSRAHEITAANVCRLAPQMGVHAAERRAAAGDAGGRRRRDVRDRGQRSLRARCRQRPPALELPAAAHARAGGCGGSRRQSRRRRGRRSRLHDDRPRAPHRAQPHAPAPCCGRRRWPTGARTTTARARRSSSTIWSSRASPAATRARADSSPRSTRRPARKCGGSGRCRRAASPARKRGRETPSIIRAPPRG